MYQSLTKTLSYTNSELEKAKILVLAPTEVAAVNIGDTTIHTSLSIPINCFGKYIPPLSDKMKSMLRNKLSEVKAINIYEKYMVSNDLLLHIHLPLEFFACPKNTAGKSFAEITIIEVRDPKQLSQG